VPIDTRGVRAAGCACTGAAFLLGTRFIDALLRMR
jgi:hypothetical protein